MIRFGVGHYEDAVANLGRQFNMPPSYRSRSIYFGQYVTYSEWAPHYFFERQSVHNTEIGVESSSENHSINRVLLLKMSNPLEPS
jgi:hypothetical protein